MKEKLLYNLIKQIEYGTNLQIGVLFFENYGNSACELPLKQTIHRSPMCDKFKAQNKWGFKRCFKCRSLAIKKALQTKQAFAGLCINGIYEYTHPVVINGKVAFLIFIGNILEKEKGYNKICKRTLGEPFPIDTMEKNITEEDCKSIALTLENYILYLLDKYSDTQVNEKIIIKNLKSFINDNLEFDISTENMAQFFHYNPRYLGRLFKKETGYYIYEYITKMRIERAKELLSRTNQSVITVANAIGFNNVTYFNKIFKEITGITPTEFRKKSR